MCASVGVAHPSPDFVQSGHCSNEHVRICSPAVCPNALATGDPSCQNGGRLHADNATQAEPWRYNNCVQCDCPPGWDGTDCGCEIPFNIALPAALMPCGAGLACTRRLQDAAGQISRLLKCQQLQVSDGCERLTPAGAPADLRGDSFCELR